MGKISAEEKLEAVQRYLNGKESSRTVADGLGISHRFLTWVKQYEYNGVEAFVKRYTNYTKQFKLDVLNYMAEQGTSLYETAAIFNISALQQCEIGKNNLKHKERMPFSQRKRGVHP